MHGYKLFPFRRISLVSHQGRLKNASKVLIPSPRYFLSEQQLFASVFLHSAHRNPLNKQIYTLAESTTSLVLTTLFNPIIGDHLSGIQYFMFHILFVCHQLPYDSNFPSSLLWFSQISFLSRAIWIVNCIRSMHRRISISYSNPHLRLFSHRYQFLKDDPNDALFSQGTKSWHYWQLSYSNTSLCSQRMREH